MKLHATCWLAPLALFLPLLWINHAALFGNTDALFYTLLMKLSGQQFLAGDFWPRWLMDADSGLGAPLMFFYPPLPYLLTALPTFLVADDGMRMLAGMYLATMASGYAAFFWLRRHFAERAALIGAALYMLLPYRLEYIYLHFNLAQLWALAFLPLWMLSCDKLLYSAQAPRGLRASMALVLADARPRILKGKRQGIAGFALCAAGVGYTHPLTLLAFGIIPIAYLCCEGGKKIVLPLLAAGALSATLLASYVVSFVSAHEWFVGDFTAGKYNLFANLSHVDSALLSGYLAVALMVFLSSQRAMPMVHSFWGIVLVCAWLMTLSFSTPLWHVLFPLQVLQFPAARLHADMLVAVVFLATTIIGCPGTIKPPPFYLRPPMLAAIIGIMLAATLVHVRDIYRGAGSLPPGYVQAMQEYSIVTVPHHLRWSDMSDAAIYRNRAGIAALAQVSEPAHVRRWKPGDIAFSTHIDGVQDQVLVRQRYAPAWEAFDRATGHPVTVEPWGEEGMIALTLPRGTHEVRLRLARNAWQWGADALSLFALAFGASLLLVKPRLPARSRSGFASAEAGRG